MFDNILNIAHTNSLNKIHFAITKLFLDVFLIYLTNTNLIRDTI